ncbi:MAG: hypothetical protein HY319_17815 [Armatimonadetes bacterium]|nr:hypothetical protein [Armatimonadota bacterium]
MNTEVYEPAVEVEKVAGLLERLQRTFKEALRILKDPKLLSDERKLSGKLERLGKLGCDLPELSRSWQSLAGELEQWQKQRRQTLPLKFGRELGEAAASAGIEFATLTTDPPTYRLAPFTVEARFGKGLAVLSYAREALGETELDGAAILRARKRFLQALEGEAFDPQSYFDQLQTAYRRVKAQSDARPGERVELVELLPELAFLMQSPKFRSNPVRENFRPYGKVRLAYDLARLKRSGTLGKDGVRLTLGTATIGTTRKKDRVLYLEDFGGRGQYYLSIAFQRS